MWYRFIDVYSGGTRKTAFDYIYIEADDQDEAISIFEKQLKEDPLDIACSCCGQNFSITWADTLEGATVPDRKITYYSSKLTAFKTHLNKENTLVISK